MGPYCRSVLSDSFMVKENCGLCYYIQVLLCLEKGPRKTKVTIGNVKLSNQMFTHFCKTETLTQIQQSTVMTHR